MKVFPDYQDAASNLERCKSIVQELKALKTEQTLSEDTSKNISVDVFGDPLEEAFNPKEVGRIGGKVGQATAAVHNLLEANDSKNIEQAGLEMIKLATEMINKKQFLESIDLLVNVRKNFHGLHAQTYKLASDAFIGLERFKDAEIFALMALHNGERSISVYVNLASFAAMRKDQVMAKEWLIEAGKIDSNNANVKQCRDLLFPSDKSREEDAPFKLK